jgi:peptidoglycan/LPS O-acetylase OafA/YrhL
MNYKEGLYKKTSGLSIKILTKIGKYSYETYLTHMIVLMVAINILTEYTIQLNIIILYALLIFIMVITAWVFSLVSSQMVLAVKWIQKVLRHINAADKE